MARQTTAYRPTPTNPNTAPNTQARSSAIEDLDDFLDEVDAILTEEETFAINFRQRGGQ